MPQRGWRIPPAKEPTKSETEFEQERAAKVNWLVTEGLLHSERIRLALLKVPREDFIPRRYRDYAYLEVPLPLPGEQSTISCPHSYPLFYEPLGLGRGHRFLEIGLGSGYGSAVAREVVGPEGLVVSIEVDPVTFAFAEANLRREGYTDVVLVNDDGSLGYFELAPYDRIAITAAVTGVPSRLLEQLKVGGRLIAPVTEPDGTQILTLLDKTPEGIERQSLCEVLYMDLR